MSFVSPNMNWTVPSVGADKNVWGKFLNAIFSTNTSTSLDACLYKLFNTNIGATAPTYPTVVAGRQWVDNSDSAQYKLKIWDGSAWTLIGNIDPATHVFSIPGSTFVVGQMILWAGVATAPQYWKACNGQDISRITYSGLYEAVTFTKTGDTSAASAIITNIASTTDLYAGMHLEVNGLPYPSTILTVDSATQVTCTNPISVNQVGVTIRFFPYGAAAVNTDFKLPDLAGRKAIASGSNGTTSHSIGKSGGKDSTTDILEHTHNSQSVGNVNGFVCGDNAGAYDINNSGGGSNKVTAFSATAGVTPASISGTAGSTLDIQNPYQVINNYIIFTGV